MASLETNCFHCIHYCNNLVKHSPFQFLQYGAFTSGLQRLVKKKKRFSYILVACHTLYTITTNRMCTKRKSRERGYLNRDRACHAIGPGPFQPDNNARSADILPVRPLRLSRQRGEANPAEATKLQSLPGQTA